MTPKIRFTTTDNSVYGQFATSVPDIQGTKSLMTLAEQVVELLKHQQNDKDV
jgi:hypothetical protein